MTFVLAYLPALRDPGELSRLQEAMKGYVTARGMPQLKGENYLTENEAGGPMLQGAIATRLQRGDVLLLPSLGSLGVKPSHQEAMLLQVMSLGVSVHLLSLMSPAENHLPALREAWAAVAHLEKEWSLAEQRIAKREEQFEEEMAEFQDEVFARASSAFGTKQLVKNLAKGDEPSPVAQFIRTKREERGWSQDVLASQVNTSKSTVQRIEKGEASDKLADILNVLSTPITEQATLGNSAS